MDFTKVITDVVGAMERAGIRYALIGGFAMALRGVQRATMDLDFILALDDLPKAEAILLGHGYKRAFQSENVSHFISPDQQWGRIDILHAFRRPTLGMLERAESIAIEPGLSLRVVHAEDIIGLKIQALVNDRTRAENDWHDIHLLLRAAREQGTTLDWNLLDEYLRIFHLESRLPELRARYEQQSA